ncbi:hypothetical protein NDU88_004065 [Pleurodeles waltl]|uniref:Uncharacterized protein n=1 Tax=Pleurodeles waltl TaxID=8319 RepID=A0AAV7MU52_PLEWA|nr:hypothetical protein NDU88_004065 [Pleurodeles waltl]
MTARPRSDPTAGQASGGRPQRPPPTHHSTAGIRAAQQGLPAKEARPGGSATTSAAGLIHRRGPSAGSRRRNTEPVAHTGTATETESGTQVSRGPRASVGCNRPLR